MPVGSMVMIHTETGNAGVLHGEEAGLIQWDALNVITGKIHLEKIRKALYRTYAHTCKVNESELSEGHVKDSIWNAEFLFLYIRPKYSANSNSHIVDNSVFIQGFLCVTTKSTDTKRQSRHFHVNLLCSKERVGRLLMSELENQAKRNNVPLITLNALDNAIGFYEKIGFKHSTDYCKFMPLKSRIRVHGTEYVGYRMSKCLLPGVKLRVPLPPGTVATPSASKTPRTKTRTKPRSTIRRKSRTGARSRVRVPKKGFGATKRSPGSSRSPGSRGSSRPTTKSVHTRFNSSTHTKWIEDE